MNDNTNFNASYSDIDTAKNNIVKTVNSINDSINNANKIVNDINSESVFSGPIAEYCLNTWNKVNNLTIDSNSALNTSGTTLNNIENNYEEKDKKTGDDISENA